MDPNRRLSHHNHELYERYSGALNACKTWNACSIDPPSGLSPNEMKGKNLAGEETNVDVGHTMQEKREETINSK